jgi:hypothetical protein
MARQLSSSTNNKASGGADKKEARTGASGASAAVSRATPRTAAAVDTGDSASPRQETGGKTKNGADASTTTARDHGDDHGDDHDRDHDGDHHDDPHAAPGSGTGTGSAKAVASKGPDTHLLLLLGTSLVVLLVSVLMLLWRPSTSAAPSGGGRS